MTSRIIYGGNHVEFLMDGANIMGLIRDQMLEIAKTDGINPSQTYVRMAFWKIAPDVKIGANQREPLIRLIKKVVQAGHNVDIIVWYPNLKTRLASVEAADHAKVHDDLATECQRINSFRHRGIVRLYRERYEGGVGASNHQKMCIFSNNGSRIAVVAGLNLENEYYDTIEHPSNGNVWHDTAVSIRGPSVTIVEDEWLRRWKRVQAIQSHWILAFKKLKNHLTTRGSGKNSVAIAKNPNEPAKYSQNTLVQIALTRSRKRGNINDIKKQLVYRIGKANRYVYLENSQLSDPEIVRALYKRLAQLPHLKIIVITNIGEGPLSYMTRRAWQQIALRHRDLETVYCQTKKGKVKFKKTDTRGWSVKDTAHQWLFETGAKRLIQMSDSKLGRISDPWLEKDKVKFRHNNVGQSIRLSQIDRIKGKFYFYTPLWIGNYDNYDTYDSPAIHSKLAIIDDKFLIVGSANWSYRSMHYDGEMTAFCGNQALAKNSLEKLLKHYNPNRTVTIDNIFEIAENNLWAINNKKKNFLKKWLLIPLEFCKGGGKDDYDSEYGFGESKKAPDRSEFGEMPHPHML
ncbi:MAG: hypothetical protein GY710_25695 [Desulfobacteraceae bacterium]|nr:hypothetical protein [Desulfobacteraceae bacterium]